MGLLQRKTVAHRGPGWVGRNGVAGMVWPEWCGRNGVAGTEEVAIEARL
jgi:hypothetical protein